MGASRSLPIWYPLSLNCCPNGLSFGQASWHEEQGIPYFRAKAGMACTLALGLGKAEAGGMTAERKSHAKTANDATAEIRWCFIWTSCLSGRRSQCARSFVSE